MSIEAAPTHWTSFPLAVFVRSLLAPVAAVGIAIVAGGVLVAAVGQNPFQVYAILIKGGLVGWPNLSVALQLTTPLIFTLSLIHI